MFACQFEHEFIVIERRRLPVFRGVAGGAISPKLAVVPVFFRMAGNAVAGCALIDIVDMATFAFKRGVASRQFEGGLIVVKGVSLPTSRGMAGGAVISELARMAVILLVAGIAVGGCLLKVCISMAALTGQPYVFASQDEYECIVVEGLRSPICSAVAGATIAAKLAQVHVFFRMTGIAVAGCTLIDLVEMTTLTTGCDVFTGQFEDGEIVIEGGRQPAFCGVAGTTIAAKTAMVRVFRCMAGAAVLRGGLELCQAEGMHVAPAALNLDMFPGQRVRHAAVIEIPAIAVLP